MDAADELAAMVLGELDILDKGSIHTRRTQSWIIRLRHKVTRFNLKTMPLPPNPLLPPAAPEEPAPLTGPPVPASGNNGRWVLIGSVGVDSATVAITDPAYADRAAPPRPILHGHNKISLFGSGVQFTAGFGDGHYDVWAWIVDYSQPDEQPDERIAQITITLIDDEDLAHWRNGNG